MLKQFLVMEIESFLVEDRKLVILILKFGYANYCLYTVLWSKKMFTSLFHFCVFHQQPEATNTGVSSRPTALTGKILCICHRLSLKLHVSRFKIQRFKDSKVYWVPRGANIHSLSMARSMARLNIIKIKKLFKWILYIDYQITVHHYHKIIG